MIQFYSHIHFGTPESLATFVLGWPSITEGDSLGKTSCSPAGSPLDAMPWEFFGNPIFLSASLVSSLLVFVSSSDLGLAGRPRARSNTPGEEDDDDIGIVIVVPDEVGEGLVTSAPGVVTVTGLAGVTEEAPGLDELFWASVEGLEVLKQW